MKINNAFILCAGFGKRLNPLTLEKPKPLLQIKNQTILEDCINTVIKLKVENIFLNTFYLSDQIIDFFKNKNFPVKIILCFFEWLFFRERITRIQMLGMMVATIGVFVVLIKAELENLLNLTFNSGDLIMVIAIIIYGLFSLLLRFSPKEVNHWSFLWVLFIIGAIELFPLQFLEYQAGYRMNLSIGPILGLSYIVICPALLAYKFYTSAVITLGVTRTGLFFYWLPIASVILAIIILGEPLQNYHIIGFVLVVCGLRLGLTKKEK